MNENEARTLIERFAEKQQGGHFACPRCREDGDGRGERHPQRTEPAGQRSISAMPVARWRRWKT